MAKYLQQHLAVLNVPIAMLAMDTIGHLPITSNGNRWGLMDIYLHTSYVFTVPMMEKFAENIVHSTVLFYHKGRSVTILSDNGIELKK